MSTIYGLLDEAGRVRYIGNTVNVKRRVAGHWGSRYRYGHACALWLRTLPSRPDYVVLKETDDDGCSTETEYIDRWHETFPGRLLNVARGQRTGDRSPRGGHPLARRTDELRKTAGR